MSRIETRQQVIRIERLENIWAFYSDFQPKITCEGEIANHLNSCLSLQSNLASTGKNLYKDAEIKGPILEMIDGSTGIKSICNSVKGQFNEIKNHLIKDFGGKFSEKEINKAAALITLGKTYSGSETNHLKKVQAILKSQDTDTAVVQALKEVEAAHETIFFGGATAAIAAASYKAGFENIKITETKNQVWVVAQSKDGKILKSEIDKPNTKDMRIVSETINVHDGSCHSAFEKFSNALKEFGVVFSDKDVIVKNEICAIPVVSNKISKQGSDNKNQSQQPLLKKQKNILRIKH